MADPGDVGAPVGDEQGGGGTLSFIVEEEMAGWRADAGLAADAQGSTWPKWNISNSCAQLYFS